MPSRAACRFSTFGAAWIIASVLTTGERVQAENFEHEIFGGFSLESRWFPETAAHPGQRSHGSGFTFTPSLYLEDDEGRSFNLSSFFRYDSADPRRTHVDLREAYVLMFGELGESEWELRFGVDRVFWGVTESNHLVDIVNQTDLVEHPDGEAKLGQPMAHITWSGDWGVLELFGLPFHRARTFPGRFGRLRSSLVVDDDQVRYESASGQRNLDLAARYSQSLGPFDIGLSAFDGNSRDPLFLPGANRGGGLALIPYYEKIRQFGLDAQLTLEDWLFKIEALQRAGALNRTGREQDYAAFVFGTEYTLYSIFASSSDLSLLTEWSYDGRGRNATSILENDLFFGVRLALNDVQDTEIVASLVADVQTSTRALAIEFNRRVWDEWSLHLQAVALLGIDEAGLHYETRRDSFLELGMTYNF